MEQSRRQKQGRLCIGGWVSRRSGHNITGHSANINKQSSDLQTFIRSHVTEL